MAENILLGGNIELSGFSDIEPAMLIVVKKIIGKYVQDLSEKTVGFEKFNLSLSNADSSFSIKAEVSLAGKESLFAENLDSNLFFAIDKSLKELEGKIN